MYYEHWGLNRQPFDNVPDPTMYFRAHESVEQAVAEVLFAIEEGDDCLAVIVGEVGLGKTTSLRVILDSLDPAKYRIAFVTNPDVTFTMLLRDIIGQLKGETCPVMRKDDLLEEFNRIIFQTADEGKRVIIFIDEGNAFKPANLESLRLLTNMQMDDRNLFTIVLAGQPKLARMLENPKRANLFQRIGVYCRLEKMQSWEVVRDYIDHRLERAGAAKKIFSDDAIRAIFDYSEQGVPRLVNKIAKLALKAAETNDMTEVSADLVKAIGERFRRFAYKAFEEAGGASEEESPRPAPRAESEEMAEEAFAPVEAAPAEAAPSEPAPAEPVQAPSMEMPLETAARTSEPEPSPAPEEPITLPSQVAARMREPETVAESAPAEGGEGGNGHSADASSVSLTRICLDEALRPEVLERVRGADRIERVKMAGQLAAEELRKHPEVVSQANDPVVTWKELRNEILSAFATEVNS